MAKPGRPTLRVRSFLDGSHAQEAGILVGDQVVAFDNVLLTDFAQVREAVSRWEIGQTVEVTVRRGNKDKVLPVKTIFSSSLRFKPVSDIKCKEPLTEKDVVILEGAIGQVAAFPIAEFVDWENPVATSEEFRSYSIAAAVHAGANGVEILNSHQEVKSFNPNADERIGFACRLLVVPKARLGIEFETGTSFENRRVIRRIQNVETENAGLRIGDNVLATSGIDVLRNAALAARDQLKWEVGQIVDVTVAREGREVTIPIKTVANTGQGSIVAK